MSRVAIVKNPDGVNATLEALRLIGSDVAEMGFDNRPILIKPNYLNAKHPSTGITTDARLIEGILKFLKELNITNEIVIGEGSGFSDTFEAFRVAGVDRIAERYGARLVDLNKDEFVEVAVPNPLSLKKVKVARTAVESVVISVPKLKPHRIATVSLSLKNMMGALASKGVMHRGVSLSENIADLASVLKPSLSVIDGIVAGEGHESAGDPVEMNLVIAGTDAVVVDSVGAAVMCIPPVEVKHLCLAERKGLGTCNLEKVTILGKSIENVKRKFARSLSSKLLVRLG